VHADLSRWIFRPERHYSRVVVQQGRVSLDADANAQASILLHYLRTLAADLIGPFGGPSNNVGFAIKTGTGAGQEGSTLEIGPGRYYVDGLLCEASGTAPVDYFQQPDGYLAQSGITALPAPPYLVWLKVWERFISSVEDPALREVALGLNGPDTTGRTRVVWQVLALPWPRQVDFPSDQQLTAQLFYEQDYWIRIEPFLSALPTGTLTAQAVQPQAAADACTLPPSSGYRGPENQLYRVEIHRDGTAQESSTGGTASGEGPTFMWSRDNGSVILPVTGISGAAVSVTTLGRDPQLSVDVGDYVEIVDDAYAAQGQPGPIARYAEPLHLVTGVDPVNLTVTLDTAPATKVGSDPALHPYLRRWDEDEVLVTKAGLMIDSQDQAIDIVAGPWIDLEDGVQVQFGAGTYRAGDYWLIPARVVTGDVEWPADDNQKPLPLPPLGVDYHLAPLAVVETDGSVVNLRKQIPPLTELMPVVVSGTAAKGVPGNEDSPAPAPAGTTRAAAKTPARARSTSRSSGSTQKDS
jgi:hypothetical protein